MNRPWMKFYPRDWRADPRLRMCSLAARGLWAELLGYMHEAEPYGHLLIDGKPPAIGDVAALVGRPVGETRKAMAELEQRGVYSLTENKIVYSRRMVRDKAKEETDRENGKGGGNPKLNGGVKGGVNPPDKAHMPEARKAEPEERKDAATAAPEVDFYRRGKEVLGQNSGGLLRQLLSAKKGSVPEARAVVEMASTKQDAREYVSAVVRGKRGDHAEQFKLIDQIREQKRSAVVFAEEVRGGIPGIE